MGRNWYLMVESDMYELPIAVAESPKELSEMVGIPAKAICEKMCRARKEGLWCEFVKIPKEGEYSLHERRVLGTAAEDGRKQRVLMVGGLERREFKSVRDAALYAGRDVSTINRWCRLGEGGGYVWSRL